jgi:cobalt-zinc-cadmium efflux system membrane fusion protein
MTRNRGVTTLIVLLVSGIIVAAIALWATKPSERLGAPVSGSPATQAAADGKNTDNVSGFVHLSAAQISQFGVETGVAGPGRLRIEVILPGEVALNADRVGHVVPRISGVVRDVRKNLGDLVQRSEVMAVLESRELADISAAYLAARGRVNLAQSSFNREEQLRQKKISPEQDYIEAQNALAEAGIELRTAEQKLRALGFSNDYIANLPDRPETAAVLYEMVAPFDATIIEKHISLGEVLHEESTAFVIADLTSVWVNLDVHQKDLSLIRPGQIAAIGVGNAMPSIEGRISFLEPMAEETNRTIHARVVLPNAEGKWRPGLFITGRIAVEDVEVKVLAPNEALIMVNGKTCVFLKDGDGFRVLQVAAGRTNGAFTEVTAGLAPGRVYVVKGAFTLKSELGKPAGEN